MCTKRHKILTTARYIFLAVLLVVVWLTQSLVSWGEGYARSVYPVISRPLSALSSLFPFSVGDLFIFLSIAGLFVYPVYARRKLVKWKKIALRLGEYLLWVYVWFYLAWGLNYSQHNFYQRTGIAYTAYTPEIFEEFLKGYIDQLNNSYIAVSHIDRKAIQHEVINQYKETGPDLGVHILRGTPRAKTMMFTPLFSKMGILGYMGPFFCEFNLNGDLPPSQYASTYAHELAHLLGITSEAEANFYAYQVCIRSDEPVVRFCGYFSVFNHILGNARRFMTDEEYRDLLDQVKPEIIELARSNGEYWNRKYSPLIGDIQGWMYDLYLKGNKIPSGRKNYSEVVGLLVSWQEHQKTDN